MYYIYSTGSHVTYVHVLQAQQALLMPSTGPGVYGNPIDMSTIYAQGALSAESLPAMWNRASGDINAPESKMVRLVRHKLSVSL